MKPILASSRVRLIPNVVTRITRALPGPGTITVPLGQEVSSGDAIATSEVSLGFHSFNLAQALGVPKGMVPKYMQRGIGQKIFKGELLASRDALFGKKDVLSPTDAIIEDYSDKTGEVRLKFSPKKETVVSGVYGIVEKVDPVKGQIEIKTVASIIHGIVGVGKDRGGVVAVLGEASGLFNTAAITSELRQHIIVAGGYLYGEAFEKAALIRASGVISGGIDLRDYKSMAGNYDITKEAILEPEISVLATEGFGSWPIGEDIYAALKDHQGKFAFLNGRTKRLLLPSSDPDSIMTVRRVSLPEILKEEDQVEVKNLSVGLRVRIIWPPFAGYIGKIIAIDQAPTSLPSGISTYMVTIETKIRKIKVAFNNVELVM